MSFLDNFFANKKSEEQTSHLLLHKFLETMRESVLVVGDDTRILGSNEAAYNSFARNNGALENKRLSEVLRDLSLHEAFRKALEDGVLSDIELEIPGLDKRKYDVRVAPIELDKKIAPLVFSMTSRKLNTSRRFARNFFQMFHTNFAHR
ncbi:MAG: hypothetical protein WKF71_00670 [Pyrinomonadaceae bacterium]